MGDAVRSTAGLVSGPGDGRPRDRTVQQVVVAFERRLRESGSRIPLDPRAHAQLREQASGVVHDVLAALNGGAGGMDDDHPLSDEIGVDRALAGLHPRESLAAAALLFEEVLRVVTPDLDGHRADDAEPPAETVRRIAVRLHQAILGRIATASVSYAGFLLTRAQEAHVEERLRVARELHDHAAHDVATAMQQVELALVHAEDGERDHLRLAAAQLRQAVESIRTVSTDLRDSVPVNGGLQAALSAYLRGHAGPGVHTTLSVQGDLDRVPRDVTEEVYLAVREAVRNALAHSGSAVLDVEVRLSRGTLAATIRDQGRGFDLAGDLGDANGLTSIRERCALLGGRSSVISTAGVGTTVEIRVPVGPS